jgi:hypothetical protein
LKQIVSTWCELVDFVQAASVKVSEIRKFRRSAGNYSYQSIFLLAEERHAIQAQSDIVLLIQKQGYEFL